MIQDNFGSMELIANHNIQQIVEVCGDFKKRNKLEKHLDQISTENAKVLIFVATKRVADGIFVKTVGLLLLSTEIKNSKPFFSKCLTAQSILKA